MQLVRCDGCGQPATAEHIVERLKRLELATRYRPIHIQLLFLADAPPPGTANDFYNPEADDSDENGPGFSRSFLKSLEITGETHEESLAEFQRRGYYLAFAIECPLNGSAALQTDSVGASRVAGSRLRDSGSTLVKRVQLSYKPRFILLVSEALQSLVPALEQAGLRNHILNGARPVLAGLPSMNRPVDASGRGALRQALAELAERTRTA